MVGTDAGRPTWPDHPTAPWTGWGRSQWADLADRLLLSLRPWASPGHGRITPPGRPGGYGHAIDGLEGFARSFLMAGFRLAGQAGVDPDNLAEWYAEGIRAGSDPGAPDRWVRLTEHPQAKVEAASIALILDWTRPWIWDRLDDAVQQRVVDWLAPAVGDETYPKTNWLWFRVVVETFLRSVEGPWSPDDIASDLDLHDSFARADGWLADGPERSFDHYVGWALHLYPTLWLRMRGAGDLVSPERRLSYRDSLDRYLMDAVHLVGADGGPLFQGRSLIYRFAAAAPFWVGALAEVPSSDPGLLRRAASGVVSHFVAHGAPDADGLLTMGWHAPWRALAQSYSGPGSPYWAAKGLLGLALPGDHPAWTSLEQPLPVERGDFVRLIEAPGWAVSGTVADGLVRIANHGSDHARPGDQVGDSPLYARLGYSTATAPLLDETAWIEPREQSVGLIDQAGRASHRAGWRRLASGLDEADGLVWSASQAQAHWIDPAPEQVRHGSGWTGAVQPAGQLTVLSLLRGPWEIRGVRVDRVDHPASSLRLGGWPLTGPAVEVGRIDPVTLATATSASDAATSASDSAPVARSASDPLGAVVLRRSDLRSDLVALTAPAVGQAARRPQASPLGDPAWAPTLDLPVQAGQWVFALVGLTGCPSTETKLAAVSIDGLGSTVVVTWPDGRVTRSQLPDLID
ncbi:MAG: DUF2264 domain-containing protein [Propionibacteriaceae bacterium]|nr:DUF2264 domain-containing protein [Propionibacteriaceae bacterium]